MEKADAAAATIDSLYPGNPLDRRGFLLATLGAGFALAVQPVMAQTAIHTPTDGLRAGTFVAKGAAGEVTGYYARPATGSEHPAGQPIVLVVSEIFGVHEYIADVCRRLARAGYFALAPELFARYGDAKTSPNIAELMSTIIAKVPDGEVMADLDACVAWAKAQGGDGGRLAITGFCWGGRIVWLYAARNPAVRSGVAWYGRLRGPLSALTPRYPLDIAGELRVPILGLYGGLDPSIPQADVEAMRAALKAAGNRSEIHVYPDAGHAFHADYRPSYRPEDAADGWQRLLAWFKANGM